MEARAAESKAGRVTTCTYFSSTPERATIISSRNKVTDHGCPFPQAPRLKKPSAIEIAGRSRIPLVLLVKKEPTPTLGDIGERKPSCRTATERNGTSSGRLLVLGRTRGPRALAEPQPSPRYKIRSRAAHHPLPVSYLRSASVRPRTPTTGQSETVRDPSAELTRLIS